MLTRMARVARMLTRITRWLAYYTYSPIVSTWSIIYEAHLLVIEYILKLLWVKHGGLHVIYSDIYGRST